MRRWVIVVPYDHRDGGPRFELEELPMDNQHRHIKGYRELSEAEIELMNRIKGIGEDVGAICDQLSDQAGLDQRWIAIGKTQLQQGFMALVRGIAQPTTF